MEANYLENRKTSIETHIEKMYKSSGTEKQEIDSYELMITEKDSNLIELDIIISNLA